MGDRAPVGRDGDLPAVSTTLGRDSMYSDSVGST